MQIIQKKQLTSGNGSNSSMNTASISPDANCLVIVAVVQHKGSTPSPTTPSVSGAGMTWTQIATYNPFADYRITLFRGLASSPGSGALTISFPGQQQDDVFWSVTEFQNVVTTGSNGSDAVVQTGTANVTSNGSTGVAVTLSALQNSQNAVFGVIRTANFSGSLNEGSGFSNVASNSFVEDAEWKVNGQTIVNWSWASSNLEALAMAIEIKAQPWAFGGGMI